MKNTADAFTPENLIPADIPSTWQVMEKLYDSGKAKAIGVSNFSLEIARVPPAVNQVECHPTFQRTKLKELCKSSGVHLSVAMHRSVQPAVISVAEKMGKTPAQICLRWGVQMGHCVLPKSTHESRIKENFDIFN
ncbi:hypothetical protein MTR67_045634 [Solanum verrucosum]|uniref:NADP-dependent oxidoreductase domain-containing protein n=1 Tax=Solanum verrucosum TaxID=315347 RepID=A0AAF0ZX70_SOLVR|nr:hypothetical protein MTR67_045634 [Solanum verrucosum]